jgi:hypothetical protein
MTYKEFMNEYKRLEECFPNKYASPDKSATIYKFVKDMDVAWMSVATDRIVASSRGDGDLVEAAATERRHKRSKRFADDLCAAQEASKYSEHGLDDILSKYKVKSLVEAIEKSKRGDFDT